MIVAQASSRFTVGQPLCRNETYLKLTYKVIDGIMFTAFASGTFPQILRPIVGRLSSWHTRRNINKVTKLFAPLYKERMEFLKHEDKIPSQNEPEDQLQMMLRFAQKKRPHELDDIDIIATRLCASNFVSMHQTTITATNMLLNVIGSDSEFNTISELRDEISHILGPSDSGWTKAKFSKMIKADSVARETMRINFPFGNRGLLRKVMKNGVVTPAGISLQNGSLISYLASPAQIDEEKFEEPLKYDPFRFSREQDATAYDGRGPHPQAFVSTSPQYLPFGHGRHACPGRFLVEIELKMILAHILENYDIKFPPEYGGKRPPNLWMAELAIPPPGAKIKVKRRKGVEG
ncbi:Ent-kaurene oxidase [Arthroderma uncinatum]|uniref:Ent-kaurene oxidase n=1 Tax=Arthroderma uncinatum TaxID=74035 RepID=UPI00144A7A98|nr:Ent-kaurene oxidase [Arthroderma uncinatum]KAF3491693.1 Ent-kaurene oxidase [Arthroderma uncinatum]